MTLADDGMGLARLEGNGDKGCWEIWIGFLMVGRFLLKGEAASTCRQINAAFLSRLREERKKAYSNAIEIVRSGFTVDVGVVERLRKLAASEEG